MTYVIDVFDSVLIGNGEVSKGYRITQILMDLPTLLLMTSFSIFIYYFSKLTIQVE